MRPSHLPKPTPTLKVVASEAARGEIVPAKPTRKWFSNIKLSTPMLVFMTITIVGLCVAVMYWHYELAFEVDGRAKLMLRPSAVPTTSPDTPEK